MAIVKIQSDIYNQSTKENYKIQKKAIQKKNKVIYKEDSVHVEITIKKDSIFMKRITEEEIYEFFFCRKNAFCKCHFLPLNQVLKLTIQVNELEINSNEFTIDYQIEKNDKFHFHFTIEELR